MKKGGILFAEVKKNREGKGGKYLEKENIFLLRRRKTDEEKKKMYFLWKRK